MGKDVKAGNLMKISLRKKLFIVIFILVAMAVFNFAALGIYEFYKFGNIIHVI